MPAGPQRQRAKASRGPNKVEGVWRGGPNYSDQPERETFRSQSHARDVMRSRASGWDPIQSVGTPVVKDSQMELYRPGSADPFLRMSQTNRGIRRERF